ncbi:MAG: DUF559 domain-containing protein [Bacteroidales bacterium]|nr:DUF559 domain-containing protein [Bacteroidales bacterium]
MITIDNIKIQELRTPDIPRNRNLLAFARKNRKGYNLAEVVFWKQVHKNMFYGIDFHRQFVIGNYIVDFYVRKLSLVVEIDGGSHNDKQEYDHKRDDFFASLGLKVFHTTDYEVLNYTDFVLNDLKQFILDNYQHC